MTKRRKGAEVEIETMSEEQPTTETPERVFDFTPEALSLTLLDPDAKKAYYLLSRKAKLTKDKDAAPDGKTYTLSEVIEILGEDYEKGLGVSPNCCR